MQIYCPKCKTGYEIKAEVVPESGRKLRCAVCEKVFKCLPEDLLDGSKLRMSEFTLEEKKHLDESGMLEEEMVSAVVEDSDFKAEIDSEVAEADSEATETDSETPEEDAEATEIDSETPEIDEESADMPSKSLEELEAEVASGGEQDVKNIFQRLSLETESLFKAEAEEKPVKKIIGDCKKSLGLLNPRNYKYYFMIILAVLLLSLYYGRFEIVRTFPSLEPVYSLFHIKSKVTGEGLEFQNITRREYEEDAVLKYEIKGFIANKTDHTIDIPVIYVEFLDKDAQSIQSQMVNSVIPLVTSNAKIAFSFVVEKPSSLTKYIYLTFTERK